MTSLQESLKLHGGGVVSIVGAGGKTSLMFRIAHELSQSGESVLTTTTTKIFKPSKKQSSQLVVSQSLDEILSKAGVLLKDKHHVTAASRVLGALIDTQSRGTKIPYHKKLVGFEPEFIDELFKSGVFDWILVEADGAAGRPLKAPASHEPVIPKSTRWLIGVFALDGVGKPLNDQWVFRPERFAEITGLQPGEAVSEASVAAAILHEKGIMKGASGHVKRYVFLNKADQPMGLATGKAVVALICSQKKAGLNRIIIGQAAHEPPVLEYFDINH
jgi:probable selenium-dependent hydroxylase accessory protein YqeC